MINLIIMRNPKLEILHCLGTPLVQYLLSSNIQYQLIVITTVIGLLLVARDSTSHSNLPALVPPIIFHKCYMNDSHLSIFARVARRKFSSSGTVLAC